MTNAHKQREYDYIVVGSGAASAPAALAIRQAGKSVIILEKTELFGGSTAISGGVAWFPDNPVGRRAGVRDTQAMAHDYLAACAEDGGLGATQARRAAFLRESPRVVAFLEKLGMRFVHAEGYADYYEGERPGGVARSRSLVAEIFNVAKLGAWSAKFRRSMLPPIRMHEYSALTLNGKTPKSLVTMARVGWRMFQNRLGRKLVGTGGSLQGRLLRLALDAGVEIELSCVVKEFIVERGRVVGVVADEAGAAVEFRSRYGVLINAGGFSRNQAMRDRFQSRLSSTDWTLSNPGDTGEMIQAAIGLGANVDTMELSWWTVTSKLPDGRLSTHTADMSKPHAIMVDSSGARYVNESTAYVDVGIAMFKRNETVPAIPSWIIIDSQHRDSYRWGGVAPGAPPQEWVTSGYMRKAQTLDVLAQQCGIDQAGLRATVARFNEFARLGEDKDFHRGIGAFHHFMGDPTHKPNRNLGTLEKAPFYAVAVYPGDVGTAGGLVTDEFARVLRADGTVIDGLYAAGNSTASLVGRSYPGAGASIGAAMVFGYVAARHALGEGARDA
ncbi:MAG: 3-oxosteroid 1-dehydrogenase [Gammaproteobacteria bacterium]|jgi:3-oxosteroid 1-dehydrogenase|nr:3-oxosteroid 1-dehydrogenase [Gammaproteobacteria bacterium]